MCASDSSRPSSSSKWNPRTHRQRIPHWEKPPDLIVRHAAEFDAGNYTPDITYVQKEITQADVPTADYLD
jgi:hypothetical protein